MPPDYYQSETMEAIDVIEAFDLNFARGNIIKYVIRAGFKDDELADLKKARYYIEREIARLEQ